jgi:hypothetical protein
MPMMWTPEADSILVKLWDEGASMAAIAAELRQAGFDANRNMVAGRRNRLKGHNVAMVMRSRPPPKFKLPQRRRPKKRIKLVSVSNVASKKPVTTDEVDRVQKQPGVDYLDNAGCKALLTKRSGPWNLQMCCGLPTGVDFEGRSSVYCQTHFRLFTQPSAPRMRVHRA